MTKNLVYADLMLKYTDRNNELMYINVLIQRRIKREYINKEFEIDDLLAPVYYEDVWDVFVECEDDNITDKQMCFDIWDNVALFVFCKLKWERMEKVSVWEFNGEKG